MERWEAINATDAGSLPEIVLKRLIQLAAPIPALVVGALVMRHEGIATAQWGLNLLVGGVTLLVCALWPSRPGNPVRHPLRLSALGLAFLAATFVHAGLMGVHRWIQLGPLAMYAGAIALPMVLVAAGELLRGSPRHVNWGVLLITATAGVLAAQPDAAQASGLAAGVAFWVLAFPGLIRERAATLGFVLLIGLVGVSWFRHDPLVPVPHVEGILLMARNAGMPWLVAATVSLALLPLPFFVGGGGPNAPTARALGGYIALCILVALVRNYPFPFLGFGVAPIIGYFIALRAALRPSEPASLGSVPSTVRSPRS